MLASVERYMKCELSGRSLNLVAPLAGMLVCLGLLGCAHTRTSAFGQDATITRCFRIEIAELAADSGRSAIGRGAVVALIEHPLLKERDNRFALRVHPKGSLPQGRIQFWSPIGADSLEIKGLGQHGPLFLFSLRGAPEGYSGTFRLYSRYSRLEADYHVLLRSLECGDPPGTSSQASGV
jgi:hypothetical protein